MPVVIQCPKCSRQLNVLESHLGALVRCPVCKTEFTAKALGVAAVPMTAPPPPPPPPPPAPALGNPPAVASFPAVAAPGAVPAGISVGDDPFWEAEPPPPPPPRRGEIYHSEFDEDENVVQSRGRPHRALLILILGGASVLTSCLFPLGWILGGMALAMGSSDLQDMSRGRVDRSGRQQTEIGRWCGLAGVIIATLVCLISLLRILSRARF